MSFADDIKGQNTQLYPIVVIDGVYYSTNNVTVDGNYCKPILMNIPSIKQSIDIESKKFKISNVNLNFNNFSFGGKRFSEQLSDTSLINKEVIIYFKSPSTNTIDDFYLAYKGVVRRISHDDTLVKIQVEDLTEKEAHKILPLTDYPDGTRGYISDDSNILDKYKNKPIPFVYGKVDRSPAVIDYSGEGYKLLFDTKPYSGLDNSSPLYVNADNFYLKIFEKLIYNDPVAFENVDVRNQWAAPTKNDIQYQIFDDYALLNVKSADSDGVAPSIVFNTLLCHYKNVPSSWNIIGINPIDATFGSVNLEGTLLIDSDNPEYALDADSNTICSIQRNDVDVIWSPSNDEITGFFERSLTEPFVSLIVNISLPSNKAFQVNYVEMNGVKIYFYDAQYQNSPAAHRYVVKDSNAKEIVTPTLTNVYHLDEGTPFTDSMSSLFNVDNISDAPIGYDINGATTVLSIPQTKENDSTVAFALHGYRTPFQIGENLNGSIYGSFNDFESVSYIYPDKVLDKTFYADIKGRVNRYSDHPVLSTQNIDLNDIEDLIYLYEEFELDVASQGIWTIYDTLIAINSVLTGGALSNDPVIVAYVLQEGVIDGWVGSAQNELIEAGYVHNNEGNLIKNPIDIIYDLLRTELDFHSINENDFLEAREQHKDWEFAFTNIKKIDSKKLIEDIAKSTKCFPKFKNDGTFGFNTIKDSYTLDDYDDAHLIKQSDVISYSFKKTKPEQIYRQVKVQYNIDYEENSLLSTTDIKDSGASDFYGIEKSSDAYLEFNSPYIRTKATAENLRDFLSSHYKNDHLIFNLKLPLQYIDLEIGELVKFQELFQGLKAYGIDYRVLQSIVRDDDVTNFGSFAYPLFMITSITKNLDSVAIECMQLHWLKGTFAIDDWITEVSFPDSDPLTITPFIPEPEEFLSGELITNNDFTNGLSNWAIGYPNGSAFDNSENISVSNNQVTMTGTTSLDYIAKVNLINSGDTRLYRLTIDIESFDGEKWDVSANGVTYPDGTGASIRSQHQAQPTGVFTTEFVWNDITHGQVPGNFEQNYGIRINSIGTMVLNSVSLREVIQEGQTNLLISGGTFENPDNWTQPNGNLSNTKIQDGFLSLIDISNGGTAKDGTTINTTLSDDFVMSSAVGDFYYSQERFDIEIEVVGSGGLFKLGVGNSQAYFDVSGPWFNVQSGINKFTGIRVSSTSDYNNFELAVFLHSNFDYGKIKSVSIVPSASQGSSATMKRKTHIIQLIEDGIHFQDNKYDLKYLRDME